MTTISSTFTDVGVSSPLFIPANSRMDFTIAGPYVGKVVLQRMVGSFDWEEVKALGSAVEIDSNLTTIGNSATYRWACTEYTSGTITYTLADSTAEVLSEWKNANGATIFKVTDAGVTLNGAATGFTVGAADPGSITLAMMADLAQDKFIGRTTASTGVPQTATITAAARTVLDDTTVAAMVDTLGGAASTGTTGLVRASGPTLVGPILGTPASGVLTNCTGTAAGLTAGAATLAADSTKVANTTPGAVGLTVLAAATAATVRVAALGAQPADATQAAVATDAATSTLPFGFTEAQANGIVTLLNRIRADLVTAGIIKGSA